MLKIQSLVKKFGSKNAVQGVSLEIKAGEVFCLIGPNGSGKTTIVKTIAGLLQPTSGKVMVGDFNVEAQAEMAKSQIGYIPDEPIVWSATTGEEFLHIVGALYGMSEAERTKGIQTLLPLFGLKSIEKEYFEDYSRGNKQKFSILAALLHQPKLLLVDEPIVGLDPTSAETAKTEFKKFAKAGGSVLMVTHTLAVAEQIADRIGFLKDGKLKAIGTMAEVRAKAGVAANATLAKVYEALT